MAKVSKQQQKMHRAKRLISQGNDAKIRSKTPSKNLEKRFATLQEVVVDLIQVRNPHELLHKIVEKAVDLLVCDAGSLYCKQENTEELVFEISLNRSQVIQLERKTIPLKHKSLATHCFLTGKAMAIEDVYQLSSEEDFKFDRSFDLKNSYRTKSMLLVPLMSSQGEKLGVIQVMNRKESKEEEWRSYDHEYIRKTPIFSEEDKKLLQSFAALASAVLENATLNKSIEQLFEGFVYASVGAIETRDRPTRGHSERVAILTIDLAEHINRSQDTDLRIIQFSPIQLRELRYAALLHDFGKIAVREETLMKAEKLHPHQQKDIRLRLDNFATGKEIHELRGLLQKLLSEQRAPRELDLAGVDRNLRKFREEMEEHWKTILMLNQPTVLDEDKGKILQALERVELLAASGKLEKLLESSEVAALSVKRGSLTPTERKEIEEHVTRTYLFLREIPWTKDLSNVPDIAHAHHEMLDGSGYPRKVQARDIPVQSRIMTICDIFDALVASDRPYKRAVPMEKALDILHMEVKNGKLDERFFRVFLEAHVYENSEFLALTFGKKEQQKATAKKKVA